MGMNIHIRNVSKTVHAKLVKMAGKKDLSLTQFLKVELEKIAKTPSAESIGEMLLNLPRQGHVTPWSSQRTVRMIHEGREEREEQIESALKRRLGKP